MGREHRQFSNKREVRRRPGEHLWGVGHLLAKNVSEEGTL